MKNRSDRIPNSSYNIYRTKVYAKARAEAYQSVREQPQMGIVQGIFLAIILGFFFFGYIIVHIIKFFS